MPTPATHTPTTQLALLEPPPAPPAETPTDAQVLVEARRIWRQSPALLQAYPVLEPLLAHPQHGRWLLMSARGALKARHRRTARQAPPAH